MREARTPDKVANMVKVSLSKWLRKGEGRKRVIAADTGERGAGQEELSVTVGLTSRRPLYINRCLVWLPEFLSLGLSFPWIAEWF